MTEEEARKKWCPMARCIPGTSQKDGSIDLHANISAANRVKFTKNDGGVNGQTLDAALCIASDCMMWRPDNRRAVETYRLPRGATEIEGSPVVRAGSLIVVKGESWRYRYSDVDADGEFDLLERKSKDDTKRGYCGLARHD